MAQLNTTWTHIRRSPYQAFAAIFILMQTFFVVSVFTFVIFGSARIVAHFESIPQVIAFFREEANQNEIKALEKEVSNSGKASKLKFVSKQEALAIYRQQFKDDPLLLELVTADILPASLEISTYKIEDLAAVADMLNRAPVVKEVVFQKDLVSTLMTWTTAIRNIGVVLIAVFALDSILIMAIVIGIKVSRKRQEVEIMRLLGATNWHISWPFVLEGIIYGVVGAFVGWGIATVVLWYATPYLATFLRNIPLLPVSHIFLLSVLAAELILAIILGAISSFFAVLRFLK